VGGGARSVLFEVRIPGVEKFTAMTKAATLPGRTITAVEVPYFGQMYKVPGDVTYTEWTTTIINDEDFLCRNYIENWMNQISTHISNVRTLPPISLEQNLEVIQYSKNGSPIKSYKLIHAWPTELAEIDLGWENSNQIEEYTVTWAYTFWEATTVESSTTALIGDAPPTFAR
jgi:hypothetical protein